MLAEDGRRGGGATSADNMRNIRAIDLGTSQLSTGLTVTTNLVGGIRRRHRATDRIAVAFVLLPTGT